MKYRQLGSTNLQVSEIGYGTWPLGGHAYGSMSNSKACELLEIAFENGINFFDTADIYGDGRAEIHLGRVFKRKREQIILCSKLGYLDETSDQQNFSVKFLMNRLDRSLKRLQTNYIDVLYLHSPRIGDVSDELMMMVEKCKNEGKVRFAGVSLRTAQDGFYFQNANIFSVFQVVYNFADRGAKENGFMEHCYKNGLGVVVKVPLCYGFLTGKYDENRLFELGDHRNRFSAELRKKWIQSSEGLALLGGLKVTTSQSALSFCLLDKAVSSVIPGMTSLSQLKENIEVMKFPLDVDR